MRISLRALKDAYLRMWGSNTDMPVDSTDPLRSEGKQEEVGFQQLTDRIQFLEGVIAIQNQKQVELISAIRSINRGKRSEIQVAGDDQPCYAQRKEWIDWVLELCDEVEESVNLARVAQK
jgi:hypothetical protein